ncbi:hypothetical protein [Phocaeicola dorei]|uniref:hypothetical protein n=1 Tax=Phocaeicola vulgatus TaxID=821 RepID=UPI0021AA366B
MKKEFTLRLDDAACAELENLKKLSGEKTDAKAIRFAIQFMKCKLYTDENIVIIMMNELDYERLKEEGIFIRDGKSRDSAGVLNTTNTFIEKK